MCNLYIIAGCNGEGKETASYSVLPDALECRTFVNADEIARGLSPFQPEEVSFQAGRIMLQRIDDLIVHGRDFAFETTLSTKSYIQTIKKAQAHNYYVTIVYFWLKSPQLAIERVQKRVAAGGHHVQDDIVIRRYERGLNNFFNLYIPICDYWLLINNSVKPSEKIAEGKVGNINIKNITLWNQIKHSIQTV
jgi:predicted ABC-type ATPase